MLNKAYDEGMNAIVNNYPIETGCYIAGHHGQYALDALAGLAMSFDIPVAATSMPAYWRLKAEDAKDSDLRDGYWEQHYECAEAIENLLNLYTSDGFIWTWVDGEFFLTDADGIV